MESVFSTPVDVAIVLGEETTFMENIYSVI
jgi:hypothetical protein